MLLSEALGPDSGATILVLNNFGHLKSPLNILVIVLLRKFSKDLSKDFTKDQHFCTRIGTLYSAPRLLCLTNNLRFPPLFLPTAAVTCAMIHFDNCCREPPSSSSSNEGPGEGKSLSVFDRYCNVDEE